MAASIRKGKEIFLKKVEIVRRSFNLAQNDRFGSRSRRIFQVETSDRLASREGLVISKRSVHVCSLGASLDFMKSG
jgi:hypothetical protein